MSGRHKMPPGGRRKAAAGSVEPEQASSEPEVAENQNAAEPVEAAAAAEGDVVAEDMADAAASDVSEPDVSESDASESDASDIDTDTDTETGAGTVEPSDEADEAEAPRTRSRVSLPVVLAAIALVLAVTCGVLRWLIVAQDQSDTARDESVQAAKEITAQMLSYETETVEQQLGAARDRMTGEFLGKYSVMINDVIPAAHAQQIAAVADVLRAGVVSAQPDSAELVLFVDQSVQVGREMPQKTVSVARATMVKVDDRWLMSKYEPVPM
ncbi:MULTISPECIES: hypothetical protein [Mycobacterium]|nr:MULTISPECIES: hypothetical protein [Mycobacterium]MCG7611421.1 hypothetical protein [Mycobacterium sp. CnD-18-1]TMS54162.1 hypothetical protein E0T84_07935 [Mycobacterium sp. DBP42]